MVVRTRLRLPVRGVRAADECGLHVVALAKPSGDRPLDRPPQMMETPRVHRLSSPARAPSGAQMDSADPAVQGLDSGRIPAGFQLDSSWIPAGFQMAAIRLGPCEAHVVSDAPFHVGGPPGPIQASRRPAATP